MADLARLFHHQWSLTLLVALYRKQPLALARQTRTDTLASLAEQGMISREGTVTLKGARVAEKSEPLLSALEKMGAQRKWSLPILHPLGRKPLRFRDLKAALPRATPRAISTALKDLAEPAPLARPP